METQKGQTLTLWQLRICSVLYAILYPIIFQLSLMSTMIADKPNVSTALFYSIVIPSLLVPFFMIIGIWKMWAQYVKGNYRKARWYSALPILMFVLVTTFIFSLDKCFR